MLIFNSGLHDKITLVCTYAKCDAFVRTKEGYQKRQGQEALGYFQRMRSEDLASDAITYNCILKTCAITQDIGMSNNEIVSLEAVEKGSHGCETRTSSSCNQYNCILKTCTITQDINMSNDC